MCSIEFDEYCTVWSETLHRSAKQRECSMCNGTIDKGEPYIKHRSMFEDNWTNECMCLVCDAMRREFCSDEHHAWMTPTSFWNYLSDCIDHGDRDDQWIPLYNRFRVHTGKPNLQLVWRPDEENERYGRWGAA